MGFTCTGFSEQELDFPFIRRSSRRACFEDVNADGNVDGVDLAVLLSQWGTCSPVACQCDFNSDGAVNGIDLALLLSKWGPCMN